MLNKKLLAIVMLVIIFGLLCGLSVGLAGCTNNGGGGDANGIPGYYATATYGAEMYSAQLTAIAGGGQ